MPQVLKEMPPRKGGPGGGRAPKYDYESMLDGKIRKYVEGVDFEPVGKNPKQGFLSGVRTAAEKKELKLVSRIVEDGVVLQAVPITDEDREARAQRAANRAANAAAKAANGNGGE